jgi:1,4-dihydroxy-2-naphthoate octaprenyltransferase
VLRAYLELTRPANVATALGDVLAGFAVAGLANTGALPWLLVSTACLYAGGVVLNDVFDRGLDAVERPERPIPSGRADAGWAAVLGVVLLSAGVGAGSRATAEAAAVAVAIVAAVLTYDGWSKRHPVLGPVTMGLCRGLNLSLGMTAVPGTLATSWPLCLLPIAYIAGVTLLSRGEVAGGRHSSATVSLGLVAGAVAALVPVALGAPHAWPGLALAVVLAWRVIPPFAAARRNPAPSTVRTAVGRGVLSLVLLDAALAAAFAGLGYGLIVLAVAAAASWLARAFTVT